MSIPLPSYIAAIAPYVPGLPEEELERTLGLPYSVKLASNENPFGPSPKALAALQGSALRLYRYPDGSAHLLRTRISELLGFPVEQIVAGNGSTEIIEIAAKTFLTDGAAAVVSECAFIMYDIACRTVNAEVRKAPMRDFTHDLEAMADAIDDRVRLVFIANPNNPTGTYVTRRAMDRFLARVPPGVLVVVDEAYREFMEAGDYPDCLDDLRAGAPVLVLRTFSKIYGLAGLRLGYGLASPQVVEAMNRVRSPFNTSSIAQVAGIAALDDSEHRDHSRRANARERERLARELAARGVAFVPSVTNFLLVDAGEDAGALFQRLLRRGVIVRPMGGYGLPQHFRLSVGTAVENDAFLHAWDADHQSSA